jgi:3-methyl-2-oxobutanoate hydroxymethyltransferase
MILEAMPSELSAEISRAVGIPVIGIGAGAGCDGQVLVIYDLLGMNPDFSPKFVKKYLDLGVLIRDAVARYNDDVKHGTFPGPEHSFAAEKEAGKSAPVLQLYSSVK